MAAPLDEKSPNAGTFCGSSWHAESSDKRDTLYLMKNFYSLEPPLPPPPHEKGLAQNKNVNGHKIQFSFSFFVN
jgi:hypothetical protein